MLDGRPNGQNQSPRPPSGTRDAMQFLVPVAASVGRTDGRTDGRQYQKPPRIRTESESCERQTRGAEAGKEFDGRVRGAGRQGGDFPSSCERSCERLFVRTQYILRIGAQTAPGAHMGSHHVDAVPTRSPSRSSQQLPSHNVNAHLARSPPPLLHCEVGTRPSVVRRSHHIGQECWTRTGGAGEDIGETGTTSQNNVNKNVHCGEEKNASSDDSDNVVDAPGWHRHRASGTVAEPPRAQSH